jgi:hypothetical protein
VLKLRAPAGSLWDGNRAMSMVATLACALLLAATAAADSKIGSSTFYNSEHKNMHRQSHRPVAGAKLQPIYGMLPAGTGGSIDDHADTAAIVIGDSFAGPLSGVFDDIARAKGVKFSMTTIPSCAAFFDRVSMDHTVADWPASHNGNPAVVDCKRVRRREMLELVRHSRPKLVFLAANWVASPQLWTAKNSVGREDPVAESLRALAATGKAIVLFGVVPGAHYNVRECMAGEGGPGFGLGAFRRCPDRSRIVAPYQGERPEKRRMAMRVVARHQLASILAKPEVAALGVGLIDPAASMCPDAENCLVSKDGEPLYSDSMHLTANGGRLMRRDIEAALARHGL